MNGQDALKWLDLIAAILARTNVVAAAAIAAMRTLYAAWSEAHPDATFEDFVSRLEAGSLDVIGSGEAWMALHGYVRQSDGIWRK
ncbi:MAG: hypothetical protein A2064_09085 [Spirochaetes bacterium GWB1_66_5]|nr:MAG: hypothetical protein A2064_09085 [Spirochaetes bacterium GWB1_66_5]